MDQVFSLHFCIRGYHCSPFLFLATCSLSSLFPLCTPPPPFFPWSRTFYNIKVIPSLSTPVFFYCRFTYSLLCFLCSRLPVVYMNYALLNLICSPTTVLLSHNSTWLLSVADPNCTQFTIHSCMVLYHNSVMSEQVTYKRSFYKRSFKEKQKVGWLWYLYVSSSGCSQTLKFDKPKFNHTCAYWKWHWVDETVVDKNGVDETAIDEME